MAMMDTITSQLRNTFRKRLMIPLKERVLCLGNKEGIIKVLPRQSQALSPLWLICVPLLRAVLSDTGRALHKFLSKSFGPTLFSCHTTFTSKDA